MKIDNIFINPCHGNEPYILGANIANHLSKQLEAKQGYAPKLIMPNLYGERQMRILKEEDLLSENMVIDHKIGKYSKPLLFKDADFNRNLIFLIGFQGDIQSAVRSRLQDYSGNTIEINTGAMYNSGNPTFFAYPTSYSELFDETWYEDELMDSIIRTNLEVACNIMNVVESEIDQFYIPSYNTFSFKERSPPTNEISTPPLKPIPRGNNLDIPANSVYVMFSGTGTQTKQLADTVKLLKRAGNNVIMPSWVNPEMDVQRSGPEIIANDNLSKVIGRAGWGIIWTCQNALTQFDHIPYCLGDESEVYFNCETLETVPMLKATEAQREHFGTLDGIAYTANKILDFLS